MTTLNDLISRYDANVFVMADAGSGSSFGELGLAVPYDDEAAASYGATEMHELPEPAMSDDGVEVHYASDWIEDSRGEFRPDNCYRYRIFF